MSAKRLRILTLIGIILIGAVIVAGLLLTYAARDQRVVPLPSAPGSIAPGGSTGGEQTDDGFVRLEVTADNVQNVIDTLHRPDSYTRKIVIENFYNVSDTESTMASYDIDVSVYGGALALRIKSASEVKNIITAGGRMYVWYDGDRAYKDLSTQQPVYGTDAGDEFQMILSYEDVLAVEPDSILEAGVTDYNGENCIFVRYEYGQLGYTTICYVSTASGLLTAAEQYDGQRLIYRMSASSYSNEIPALSAFALPDGKNAIGSL